MNPRYPLTIPGFSPTGATGNPGVYTTLSPAAQQAQQALGNRSPAGATLTAEDWETRVLAPLVAAINAADGWERKRLIAQYEDAQKARDNAMAIAQLNNQTSRYGTDQQTLVSLRGLEQTARQFEQTHGLNLAKAYTEYASTPDQAFAMADFKSALGRVSQGYSPAPLATQGTPKAKGWADFAALAGYNTPMVQASRGGGGAAGAGGAGGGGGQSQQDPRLKAMKAIGEAMPPSDDPGQDGQDWQAIRAIESLYFAGRPGEVERLGKPRRKIAMAGLARGGWDPNLVEDERIRGLPHQGAAGAA